MSGLSFQHEENEKPFGIFHPTGYMIGAFKNYDAAEKAAAKLLEAGFASDTVHAVAPDQVQHAIEQAHPPESMLEMLKETLAKTIGSEGYYWDQDLDMARQGAGFITVYCGDNEQAERAADLLKPMDPQALRRYYRLVIEDLLHTELPPAM